MAAMRWTDRPQGCVSGFSWTGELSGFGAEPHRAGMLNTEINRPWACHRGTGVPVPAHERVQTSPKVVVGCSGVQRAVTGPLSACPERCWHTWRVFWEG